jgi:hypothetical protein
MIMACLVEADILLAELAPCVGAIGVVDSKYYSFGFID